MQHKLIHEAPGQHGPQRTFAVVLETGDEVMACLKDFIAREKIHAAQITAIGALSNVVLNYFDWERKAYQNIPVAEQVEVASLIGDVAEAPDGKPALHVHIVVGRRDGTAMAGHLGEAHVRPTLEVILTEAPRTCARSWTRKAGSR
jgi:predicted DNA-binding protein with PD1-like motif